MMWSWCGHGVKVGGGWILTGARPSSAFHKTVRVHRTGPWIRAWAGSGMWLGADGQRGPYLPSSYACALF